MILAVIAYMTLGIDVSRLFSEMVMVRNNSLLVGWLCVCGWLSSAYLTLVCVWCQLDRLVQAASTRDVIQKKMVYLYLCSFAEQKSELAIMAINTLQKDCKDDDPMVRGLSIRSLCSLRVPNIVEWALPSVRLLLADSSPYVRKTAVIGVAKLYRIAPTTIKGNCTTLRHTNRPSDPPRHVSTLLTVLFVMRHRF